MTLDQCLAKACEQVPGLRQGALALLPEGLLIGGVGAGNSLEREPLARSAARCLGLTPERVGAVDAGGAFVEHVFVGPQELFVIAQGKRYPRLALALSCDTETNLAFVLSASRRALRALEATIDLQELDLG